MNWSQQVEIAGTGIALPTRIVTSDEIDRHQGLAIGHTYRKTGVLSRHYVTSESASELAVEAIGVALKNADIGFNEVDCLIAASGTAEQAIPCDAAKIHARLGFSTPIPAFDINMTCLSSLKALEMASLMISGGMHNTVLIASSDIASAGVNWNNRETGGLFGDGAAALILRKSSGGTAGFQSFNFETHSEGVDYCQVRGGGTLNHPSKIKGDYLSYCLFEMQGKELYRLTFQVLENFINRTLAKCEIDLADIDWVVPHQASALAISHLQKKLNLTSEKVVNILETRGNQIAVSIPSAYHELMQSNRVRKGDKILFIGTSAGLSLGAAVMEI